MRRISRAVLSRVCSVLSLRAVVFPYSGGEQSCLQGPLELLLAVGNSQS